MIEPWALRIYQFGNGNIAVFDRYGQQVPAFQGHYSHALPAIIKYLKDKLEKTTWVYVDDQADKD